MTSLIWKLPHKVIGGDCYLSKGPLMTRFALFRSRWFNLYLHCFHRSDMDRYCHDHPWDFVTFLLSGGYWEHTPEGRFWRRRFSILFRRAEWKHWVEVPKPNIWTLVIRRAARREWGFWTEKGWQRWDVVNYEKVCE